jgi:hypothetical protein
MKSLPNIHDHSLLEYRVDLANHRITLITLPESARSLPNISPAKTVFEGREGHHFDRVSSGVIFLDIEEAPLVEFLKAHEVELDEGSKSVGASSWWGGGCFHTPNLFGLWVAPGFNDPEHYTAYLLQGGVEMPDREYYLSNSDSIRDIRTKYQTHVSAMLKLAGFTDMDIRAQRIVALEHAIAEKHIPLADQHDIYKANNTWKRADFTANAPGLDWAEYFRGAGLSGQPSFIVWETHSLYWRVSSGCLCRAGHMERLAGLPPD